MAKTSMRDGVGGGGRLSLGEGLLEWHQEDAHGSYAQMPNTSPWLVLQIQELPQ
jgi:hypothetical protein